MPPTCNQATRPDSAIFSRELAPFVTSIRVLGSEWFPTHCPVICTLTLPGPSLFRRSIRLPKSWCDFGPTPEQLDQAFRERFADHQIDTLEEWGQTVEGTVDQWLSQQQSPHLPQTLPKTFRGRCQTPRIVKSPIFSPLRKGVEGDFEPSDEVLSVSTKRHVTQIRRIKSLKQRINHEGFVTPQSSKFQGLQDEWKCILRAPVMAKHFAFWIASQPELGNIPWPLPSVQWLEDLLCLTKHHLAIALNFDRKCFEQKQKYAKTLDNKFLGSKRAFSYVRGSPRSPVSQVKESVDIDVDVTWDEQHHQIHIDSPLADRLQVATPVSLLETTGVIVAKGSQQVSIALQQWPDERPPQLHVSQQSVHVNPEDVAEKLSEFWLPLWTLPDNVDQQDFDLDIILRHLPPQEPVHIEVTLDRLKKSIARLRSSSALGVDGVSAQELKSLPDSILALLCDVMSKYSTGYPKDFMIARTFPLNKVEGTPFNFQTRPITVLAQIYRVWSSMICHQVLEQWGARFPKQVTGFLPKRGALLAAYAAQAEHEIDGFQGLQSSGLTLDLRKCFNLIRQRAAFRVLEALLIPTFVLNQWIGSIQQVTRYWIIENNVHGPYACNNGLPEGDVFSVVAMLGIALCWTSHAQAVTDSQVTTWAYADNWAWKVYRTELHRLVYQATSNVVKAFGLSIDFEKTWFWASHNSIASHVSDILQELIPHVAIQRRHQAKDLGLEMRYSGPNRLGHVRSRYQEGQARIARLASLQETLTVKEHLLDSSIWPSAFYGSEMYPVPQQTIHAFRSCAADALFGASHAMNPALALLFTTGRILDPGFTCIVNAIRTARAWLWKQDQDIRQKFFACVSQATGMPKDVKGPAATLKIYLSRVNWNLDSRGFIEVDGFIRCHLVEDSFQRIYRFLVRACEQDFLVLHSHRKDLHHLRNPSRCDTVQILAKFSDAIRRSLIREIAGAFQLSKQKVKWQAKTSSLCDFCDQEDSRTHRLTECPAFEEVRKPFQDVISSLVELDHPMLYFPIIHSHPNADAQLCLQFNEPTAHICEAALHQADQIRAVGCVPWFFH